MRKQWLIVIHLLFLQTGMLLSCKGPNQVAQGNVLYVGTPGDYPPLTSYDTATKKFSGRDIDLAIVLGKYLHRNVVFIKTSWPTLQADLSAGKFDIAIGGISVNTERQKHFLFSDHIIEDRKVALMRTGDSAKFTDLQHIDVKGVRIIENRGGTNEKFAREHIRQATIIINEDNQQVFGLLKDSIADVMFTDETEAVYRQQLMPGLFVKRLNDSISPVFYKAIMLPESSIELQTKINRWLKSR
ncbi:MAG TPA: transporter substrate-binding domain-containing protein [Chitinophaga sp.]|uniref:transporter substrate-binding domain-containing protein n=1 Tax=Chitinophaga sp. TaxID=1869181 RepID=UPI002BC18B15|nr:transporter substrate-binding domain-containing protein [Chitinophaga sp.]HVI45036.1 transporter substrate-binding domain-containing protein [Chitinophaga sp.]